MSRLRVFDFALGGNEMHFGRLSLAFVMAAALSAWSGCGKVNLHCAPGEEQCGGSCVDLTNDAANCGSCGHSCGTGGVCAASTCACTGGSTICGDTCVDTASDVDNCGSCGHACGTDGVCSGGTCSCTGASMLCGTSCIDTTSDDANCGSCGHACSGGQTCQSSTCACTGGTGLCGGVCCGAGNVCNAGSCMAPPAPNIATRWKDPTGSLDIMNMPIKMTFSPTGLPGTIYECRTGPASSFTPTTPAWAACDGAAGTMPTYQPVLPFGFDQGGSMRTEFRYRLPDPYTSPVVSYDFYLHNSLNAVGSCPDPMNGQVEPRFDDAAYFTFAKTVPGFNPNNVFPAGAQLRNPFISIPFKNVATSAGERVNHYILDGSNMRFPATGNLPLSFDYTLKTLSLRHRFVMSSDNTMVLMRRQYAFSTGAGGNDCRNLIWVASKMSTIDGPVDLRGRRKIDCEAIVVNANGAGVCLFGNPIQAIPWDQTIPGTGTVGAGTITNAANSSQVTASAAGNFNAVVVGNYIRISGEAIWRRVVSVNAAAAPPVLFVSSPIPAAHSGATGAWNLFTGTPNKLLIAPTGYMRLRTTRASMNSANRSKCTGDPACNGNNDNASSHDWYLPP